MTPNEVLDLARRGDSAALDADRPALRQAVAAFASAGDAAAALELVARASRVWLSRGELAEGTAAVAEATSAPGASEVPAWYARALYADGLFAFRMGDQERCRARNEECVQVARERGDVRGESDGLTGLARVALRDGRYGDVVELAREAREKARTAGDVEAEAAPLHLHAAGVRLQHRFREARVLYLESLELNQRLGNAAWVAMEQHNLGWVELHLGDVAGAEGRFRACAPRGVEDPWAELNRAGVACVRGEMDVARRHHAAGLTLLRERGGVPDPDDQSELDWLAARLA